MNDNADHSTDTPQPSDKLRALDRLVGRWEITGAATTTIAPVGALLPV